MAKKKSKANKTEVDALVERAKSMSSEMVVIRDAEQSRLQAIFAEMDDVLRQAIILEAEAAHNNARRQGLEERLRDLRSNEEKTQSTAISLEKQFKKSEIRLDELERSITGLRRKIDSTKRGVANLEKEKGKLTKEAAQLGKEQRKLAKEVDRHEKEKTRAEDDVKRLEKLREEYLAAIAKLKTMKADLTP